MDLKNLTMRRHAPHLVNFINAHKFQFGAEIGVAMGRTLLGVLQNCPTIKRMYAVDAFEYVEDSSDSGMYKNMDHANNEYCVQTVASAYRGKVIVLKGLSNLMAKKIDNGSLDFVFIDASHEYNEVLKDIKAWKGKIRSGGWCMGHDYCERWDGVRLAVKQMFGKPLLLEETIWAHQM